MFCNDSGRGEVLPNDAGDTDEILDGSHGLVADP